MDTKTPYEKYLAWKDFSRSTSKTHSSSPIQLTSSIKPKSAAKLSRNNNSNFSFTGTTPGKYSRKKSFYIDSKVIFNLIIE